MQPFWEWFAKLFPRVSASAQHKTFVDDGPKSYHPVGNLLFNAAHSADGADRPELGTSISLLLLPDLRLGRADVPDVRCSGWQARSEHRPVIAPRAVV